MGMQIVPGRRGLIAVRAETPGDVKSAIETVNRSFEAFKAEHTSQLADMRKGFDDQAALILSALLGVSVAAREVGKVTAASTIKAITTAAARR